MAKCPWIICSERTLCEIHNPTSWNVDERKSPDVHAFMRILCECVESFSKWKIVSSLFLGEWSSKDSNWVDTCFNPLGAWPQCFEPHEIWNKMCLIKDLPSLSLDSCSKLPHFCLGNLDTSCHQFKCLFVLHWVWTSVCHGSSANHCVSALRHSWQPQCQIHCQSPSMFCLASQTSARPSWLFVARLAWSKKGITQVMQVPCETWRV